VAVTWAVFWPVWLELFPFITRKAIPPATSKTTTAATTQTQAGIPFFSWGVAG
jgi:hypothetical protein